MGSCNRLLEAGSMRRAAESRKGIECGRRNSEMVQGAGFAGQSDGSGMHRDLLQIVERLVESFLIGITGRHSDPHPADRYMNLGSDLQ